MSFGPRASRAASSATAVAVVATLALAACGSSKYQYVKNTSQRSFVKIPSTWELYDEDQILQNSDDSAEAKDSFKQLSWSVGFDASPKPSVSHVLSEPRHLTGIVQVRTLTESQRDTFSQASLRSLLLPFDPLSAEAAETGDVEVLGTRAVDKDGLHGNEFLLNLKTQDGGTIKWRQIALVDGRVSKAHVLAITCDTDCYEANEGVIEKVIASWKVEDN